jgi:hypothetical protein
MADNIKPQLEVGEGEAYLFVRLNLKKGEFQVLHSNFFDGLALLELADTHMDQAKRQMMAPLPALATSPNFQLPSLDVLLRKNKA